MTVGFTYIPYSYMEPLGLLLLMIQILNHPVCTILPYILGFWCILLCSIDIICSIWKQTVNTITAQNHHNKPKKPLFYVLPGSRSAATRSFWSVGCFQQLGLLGPISAHQRALRARWCPLGVDYWGLSGPVGVPRLHWIGLFGTLEFTEAQCPSCQVAPMRARI